MAYEIGDRVKTKITDREGVVVAKDGREDEYNKVKVDYDGWFSGASWEFESMLTDVITDHDQD